MVKLVHNAQGYSNFKKDLKNKGYTEVTEQRITEAFPSIFYVELKDNTAKIVQINPEIIQEYNKAFDDMWK